MPTSLLVFPILVPSGGQASARAKTEAHMRGSRKEERLRGGNHHGFQADGQAKPVSRTFHLPSSWFLHVSASSSVEIN